MPTDNTMRFTVDGKPYELDPDDLTLDELGAIEDFVGRSYHDIDFESARGLQALAWIAIRQKEPGFSIQDAGAIKITAFGAEANGNGKPRPTRARAKTTSPA